RPQPCVRPRPCNRYQRAAGVPVFLIWINVIKLWRLTRYLTHLVPFSNDLFNNKTSVTPKSKCMCDRYETKPEVSGWTIYDAGTGLPAILDGLVLSALCFQEAHDLAGLLNVLHLEQITATIH